MRRPPSPGRVRVFLALTAVVLCIAALALGRCAADGVSPEPIVYFGSARNLQVVPPRVSGAPSIDGLLNDPVWTQAAVLDSFTQGRPIEAVPDSLGTRCYVMYDERNLY